MPETPCLFGNQTAVFLKCAEIDCALESAKKPRTAGLCGRAAGACDCGLLSCALIERVNKGLKPPKQGMVRGKNSLSKDSFLHHQSSIHKALSNFAHKRRNVRFNGLCRAHTPPQPLNAHTAAHRANGAGKRGATLCGTSESTKICENAFKFEMEENCRRRTTADELRLPAKGGLTQFGGAAGPQARTAPLLCLSSHRWVPRFFRSQQQNAEKHISCFYTLDCSMCLATRCRSFALSTASICR